MDSISVDTPSAPPRLHQRPPQPNSINGLSGSNMEQINLPPISSGMEATDPPKRNHPLGHSIPAPPLAKASCSIKQENLPFEEKIQKIHEDASVPKELVKNQKPDVVFQLEDYDVLVYCMVNEANSATNDLKHPSFHNETIRIVKVIDVIVTLDC